SGGKWSTWVQTRSLRRLVDHLSPAPPDRTQAERFPDREDGPQGVFCDVGVAEAAERPPLRLDEILAYAVVEEHHRIQSAAHAVELDRDLAFYVGKIEISHAERRRDRKLANR